MEDLTPTPNRAVQARGQPSFQKPWEAGAEPELQTPPQPHHNFPLGESVQGVATDSEAPGEQPWGVEY